MVFESLASEEQLGPRHSEHRIHVSLDLDVVPGEDGTDGEVTELPVLSQSLDLVQNAPLDPLVMGEEDALGGTLLPGVGIGIVVTHVGHVVHVGVGEGVHVRAE